MKIGSASLASYRLDESCTAGVVRNHLLRLQESRNVDLVSQPDI